MTRTLQDSLRAFGAVTVVACAMVAGCSRQAPEPDAAAAPAVAPAGAAANPPVTPTEHTRPGHSAPCACVAFSPDGKRLASGSYDRTVRVWDVTTGDNLLILRTDDDYINWVAFSPDGKRLAAVGDRYGEPGAVHVWDAADGKHLLALRGHTLPLSRCVFSPDGTRLASASADRTVKIWDLASGKDVLTLRGHPGPVNSIAYGPDGLRLAASCYVPVVIGKEAGEVRVWDTDAGKELLAIPTPTSAQSVAFSPDGQRLAAACGDHSHVWDAASGKEILALQGAGFVDFLTYRPDGRQLAGVVHVWNPTTRQPTAAVRLWDAATGRELRTVGARELRTIDLAAGTLAYSPDNRLLAGAGTDVKVWDAAAGKPLLTLTGLTAADFPLALNVFSPDARRLASVARQSKTPGAELKVRAVPGGRELATLRHPDTWIFYAAFSPDGRYVATAGGAEPKGEVRLWDADTGKELHRFTGDQGEQRYVAFSPDGKQVLAVRSRGGDTVGTVWEVASGQQVLVLHRKGAGGLLFHPDGRLLEWSGMRLRDTATGQDVLTVRGQTPQGFTTAVFSRDGKRLATAEGPAPPLAGVGGLPEAEVRLWDATTGQELKVFRGHPRTVRCLALSPDATRLASGGEDHNVKVWDTATGREVLTYRGHALSVWHVMFTEDGKRVASVGMDGTLKVWDAATGQDVP